MTARAVPRAAEGAPARPAAADSDIRQQLERVAENLFALEVNTIFKENITATRMPHLAHALIDIVNDYDAQLAELGNGGPQHNGKASWTIFDELRERASNIFKNVKNARREGVAYTQSALLMVCRIRDNSDQLKGVFQALEAREGPVRELSRKDAPELRLLPDEIMTIRKIWEVGTEVIAMQTVIQLDGDVVTRLQRAYAKSKDDPLIAIHNSAVSTSVGTWNRLVDTVSAFVRGAAELFLGR